jgi:hypothetical protein
MWQFKTLHACYVTETGGSSDYKCSLMVYFSIFPLINVRLMHGVLGSSRDEAPDTPVIQKSVADCTSFLASIIETLLYK